MSQGREACARYSFLLHNDGRDSSALHCSKKCTKFTHFSSSLCLLISRDSFALDTFLLFFKQVSWFEPARRMDKREANNLERNNNCSHCIFLLSRSSFFCFNFELFWLEDVSFRCGISRCRNEYHWGAPSWTTSYPL